MARASFKTMLTELIPLALTGAGDDERALLLVQQADVAVRAAYEHQKLRQKAAYAANPEPFKQRAKVRGVTLRAENNEARRVRRAKRSTHDIRKEREYAEIRTATGKAAKYREATRDTQRANSRKRAAEVTEGYARELLAKNSPAPARAFPLELVQLKQIEIKLKRNTK